MSRPKHVVRAQTHPMRESNALPNVFHSTVLP